MQSDGMKISNLKTGMKDIRLRARVVEVLKPIELMTDCESYKRINNFMIEDRTGTIRLVLWEKGEKIEEEDTIEIKNGFVREVNGELQIGLTEEGEVKIL